MGYHSQLYPGATVDTGATRLNDISPNGVVCSDRKTEDSEISQRSTGKCSDTESVMKVHKSNEVTVVSASLSATLPALAS